MCYHVVADTTKVRIFKQITTSNGIGENLLTLLLIPQRYEFSSKSQQLLLAMCLRTRCCWYHKGTNFQANHNTIKLQYREDGVVADTTKVRIFKQITTHIFLTYCINALLLIPQRYEFSSKSQQLAERQYFKRCCCWYHKGTNFQANHNTDLLQVQVQAVVADTTKVRIFKQITTVLRY